MSDPHDIARKMAALPGWRWPPDGGARAIRESDGVAFRIVLAGDAYEDRDGTAEWVNANDGGFIPDLTDPATLGAIEHGQLAPAGVWVERIRVGVDTYSWRACDPCGPLPMVGAQRAWRDSLPAALLDGLRAVRS